MKTKIILFGYWIETRITKILNFFNISYDIGPIPEGMYCYEWDKERNEKEPLENGYWTKTCKYYRSTPKTKGMACTYIGYYGFDFCLYDQCKICGIKNELDERDLYD